MKRLTILFSPAVAANIKHYSHLIMNRFLPACILAMCVSLFVACNSDDDNKNAPTPPGSSTTGFITSIADPDVTTHFEYDNGVMTGGHDDDYGDFTIQRNPFLITSRYEDGEKFLYFNFKDIQTNKKGFITSAPFTFREKDRDGDRYYESARTGQVTAEYDKDGYLTKLVSKDNRTEDTMICTWIKGNLVKLQETWEEKTEEGKVDDAGSETFTLTYSEDAPINSGIYIMGGSILEAGLPTFLWYTGLWGKPTRNIPTIIKREYRGWNDYGTPITSTSTEYYGASYDNKGRINMLYWNDRPYMAVAYDGATAVAPED